MKKRISISAFIENQTTRFFKVKMEKVEKICSECGGMECASKVYGTIFVSKLAGTTTPEEILISIKEKKGEGPDDRKSGV